MKLDQVFGALLILLAIYLGIQAGGRGDGGDGLFSGSDGLFSGSDNSGDLTVDDIVVDDDADGTADGDAADGGSDIKEKKKKPGDGEKAIRTSAFCENVGRESQFDDVGEKYDDAVRCMEAAEVVEGVSDDTYAPGDALIRAQAATTIAALIDSANGLERSGVDLAELPDAPETPLFDDVPADMPEADAIAQLNEVGILEGYVNRLYEPNGQVTRAQMASILDRTYKYLTGEAFPGGSDQFSDDDRSVHRDSINAVVAADIMTGIDGNFEPNLYVKRGPMAAYAARTMIRLEETGRIRPVE